MFCRLMMNLNIEIYTERTSHVEDFLSRHGSVFHSYPFLTAVGEDYQCVLAREVSSGVIAGVLPVVRTSKYGLKSYHIPPFAYQFGPVVDPNFRKSYFDVLKTLLDSISKPSHLDFKLSICDDDILPFRQLRFSLSPNQTHYFSGKEEYGVKSLTKDKLRDVKRLEQKVELGELMVVENDFENLSAIERMWEGTALRANFNPHLDKLKKLFSSGIPHYSNVIISSCGLPLAGTFCPYDRWNMYHLISASSRVDDPVLKRCNVLSLYMAVSFANQRGLGFDFEGSNIPGVANFYRMMGGRPRIVYRAQRSKSFYYHILRALDVVRSERSQ